MHKKVLFTLIILSLAVLFSACNNDGNKTEPPTPSVVSVETSEATPISDDDEIIVFKDKTIEMIAKEMFRHDDDEIRIYKKENNIDIYHLGNEDFNITKRDALAFKKFGARYSSEIGLIKLKGDIESLEDLQWFPNVKKIYFEDCNLSDLSGIEIFEDLEVLYLRKNNITDISPIKNLTKLKILNISENNITDISPLAGLSKLTELDTSYNNFDDINVLYNLENLTAINLDENPISDEDLRNFLEDRENSHITYEMIDKIHPDMPDFRFVVSGYHTTKGMFSDTNAAERLKVYNIETDEKLCDIYLPDYTYWGGMTQSYAPTNGNLGLKLIDFNFDGYKDIELYDTQNGNTYTEYLYISWNPQLQIFEMDKDLDLLRNAEIDTENQEIMKWDGGRIHYNEGSTTTYYKYFDYEIKEIRQKHRIVRETGAAYGDVIPEANEYYEGIRQITLLHEIITDSTNNNSEIENKYILYKILENQHWEEILQIDFHSEQGQRIYELENKNLQSERPQ